MKKKNNLRKRYLFLTLFNILLTLILEKKNENELEKKLYIAYAGGGLFEDHLVLVENILTFFEIFFDLE